MPRRSSIVSGLFLVPVLAVVACTAGVSSDGESVGASTPTGSGLNTVPRQWYTANCPETPSPGAAACMSHTLTDENGNILAAATPQGLGPSQLRAAYGLPATGGAGETIAIVDAQHDPTAEADLGVYRSQYGLPACTTANGCFKQVNQNGVAGSYPTADSGWATEISLDLDMASAACPSCKIILVEVNSANMADLGAGVNEAAALGATVISNSYGGPEDSTTNTESTKYFNHPGVLITASAGDDGYGASFPATSQYVLAVGGTTLKQSTGSTRGWTETAWSSGGSGCSAYVAKPSWQKDTGCTKRMEADVSAVGDPNTGVAVYDSYANTGGWIVVGGTSASSPLVASIFAVTGKANTATPQFPYANPSLFFDITSGSNGSCSASYECKAGTGYDGPTGIGSPNVAAWGTIGTGSSSGGSSSSSSSGSSSGSSSSSSSGASSSSSSGSSSGSSSSSSSGSSSGGSSGGGIGTCKHDPCATGTKLKTGCDTCATTICAEDSYCCRVTWDSICVEEADAACSSCK